MALENDIQQETESMRQAVQSGTATINELEKSLKKFQKDLKEAIPASLGSAAKGVSSFSKQLAEGDAGLKTLNTLIDASANAFGGVAKAVPYLGEAINAALHAVADASKFLINQLDETAKSFNEISSVGASGAQGMTAIREQFARAGLSLQVFQKHVMANSETLAQFRGLTSKGAEDFSQIVGDLTQGTDQSLRKLGLSADQIAGTTGAYLRQQTMLGRAQFMTNEQLRKGTIEYAKELDLVAKLTGQNREAIEKQREAALNESRFRATFEKEQRAGRGEAADAMLTFQNIINKQAPDIAQGLRDMYSGLVNTPAAIKAMNTLGADSLNLVNDIKYSRVKDLGTMLRRLQTGLGANVPLVLDQNEANLEANEIFNDTAGIINVMNMKIGANGEIVAEAAKVQNTQLNATDKLTQSVIVAQQNIELLGVRTSLLATQALPLAADAVAAATRAMIKMYDWAEKHLVEKSFAEIATEVIKETLKFILQYAIDNLTPTGMARNLINGVRGMFGGEQIAAPSGSGAFASSLVDKLIPNVGGGSSNLNVPPTPTESGQPNPGLLAPIKTKDGKTVLVAAAQAQKFQNMINWLEERGYKIKGMSGYRVSKIDGTNTWSEHTKGGALDINPGENPVTYGSAVSDMPAGVSEAAKSFGLGWGGDWKGSKKDTMHFSVAKHEGGSGYDTGPNSVYMPNVTPAAENPVIAPVSATPPPSTTTSSQDVVVLLAQLARLDEMVSIMKNQLTTSENILKRTH